MTHREHPTERTRSPYLWATLWESARSFRRQHGRRLGWQILAKVGAFVPNLLVLWGDVRRTPSYRNERSDWSATVALTVQELGETVRSTRKQQGLDQLLLGDLAGVSDRFLRDLEHGKPTVRLKEVLQVLDALGLTLQVHPR